MRSIVLIATLLVTSCATPGRLSGPSVDEVFQQQIRIGSSRAQVEAILGRPSGCEWELQPDGSRIAACTYEAPGGFYTVGYRNDTVRVVQRSSSYR